MGQKTHPIGFRLSINQKTKSQWFENYTNYSIFIKKDIKCFNFFNTKYKNNAIATVLIKRNIQQQQICVFIYTVFPELFYKNKTILQSIYNKSKKFYTFSHNLKLQFLKIDKPELKPSLLIIFIEKQITNKISFHRITQTVLNQIEQNQLQGIKIKISGRLNGIEKACTEWFQEGRIPLQTLNAKIDYAQKNISTKFGLLGIKIWILKK